MSMSTKSEQSKRTQIIWISNLHSALRTALACIIVGCTTLYGPEYIRKQVAFPAYSYVVVILISSNATLGDAIRGCWQALYATFQTVCPALLCLSVVGLTRLTATSASLLLAIAAFFIALPEWTHIVAKRIALGQLVLIYVFGYINADHLVASMHPLHVAASVALGALASFIALLLPFPHLASSEVKHNSKLFAENASERLTIFVKAFCTEDSVSSQGLISQGKSLATKSNKILQCIKSRHESMHCERFMMQFLRPYCKNPGDRFQELETPLRGHSNDFLQTLQTPPSNEKDLLSYFFLFCMNLLYIQSRLMSLPQSNHKLDKMNLETHDQTNGIGHSLKGVWVKYCTVSQKRLIPALKCSLSLGLAVVFGIYYSKPNGFWAGLPVAISVAVSRQATFKVTNVKFQGTVIGNVYGILGCFVFERFVQVRFIALLPWLIFTTFLHQSKMYGQGGAVSAAIGAILILGRKKFGPPSEFAFERIIETFIGLTCSVIVELLLQPTRAASLAKAQLSKSLCTLQKSLTSIDLLVMSKAELLERARELKRELGELENYVDEAEAEPSFWFIPFQSISYKKILDSLMKMSDTLLFVAHALGVLEEQFRRLEVMGSKDVLDKINGDIKLVGKKTGFWIKCLEEITSTKSLVLLDKELVKNGKSYDVELGKMSSNSNDVGTISVLFLDHLKEVCEKIRFSEDEEKIKSRMVMSWSAIGFCMNCLIKETDDIEKEVKELVQCENPKSHINLRELSCKIHALYN